MQETMRFYTKEDMQPVVDFMAKYLDLLPKEEYRVNLKKITDNFSVALKAAADNPEKHAYLYALYVNNASAMASNLFEYHVMTPEIQEAFYALPSRADADEAIKPYVEESKAEQDSIVKAQEAYMEHNRGLEVFKGIALGDSPEDAKAAVEQHEQKTAELMNGQR